MTELSILFPQILLATISPGEAIATLYNPNSFEARFTVSYDIVSRLTVGKPVVVRLADNRNVSLKGNISELASSTDTVSSYPVVVKLAEILIQTSSQAWQLRWF